MNEPTLEELETRLKTHDYTYQMTDDYRWWSAGEVDRRAIGAMIKFLVNINKRKVKKLIKKYKRKYGTNFLYFVKEVIVEVQTRPPVEIEVD